MAVRGGGDFGPMWAWVITLKKLSFTSFGYIFFDILHFKPYSNRMGKDVFEYIRMLFFPIVWLKQDKFDFRATPSAGN